MPEAYGSLGPQLHFLAEMVEKAEKEARNNQLNEKHDILKNRTYDPNMSAIQSILSAYQSSILALKKKDEAGMSGQHIHDSSSSGYVMALYGMFGSPSTTASNGYHNISYAPNAQAGSAYSSSLGGGYRGAYR